MLYLFYLISEMSKVPEVVTNTVCDIEYQRDCDSEEELDEDEDFADDLDPDVEDLFLETFEDVDSNKQKVFVVDLDRFKDESNNNAR